MPTIEETKKDLEELVVKINRGATDLAEAGRRNDDRVGEFDKRIEKMGADFDSLRSGLADLSGVLDTTTTKLAAAEAALASRGAASVSSADEEKEHDRAYFGSFMGQLRRQAKLANPDAQIRLSETDEALASRESLRYLEQFGNGNMLDEQMRRDFQVGTFEAGGVLVPAVMAARILERVLTVSAVRAEANVVTLLKGVEYKIPAEGSSPEFEVGWVGEGVARPKTNHPSLKEISIIAHEQYAQPAATQLMLDVSSFNFQEWMMRRLTQSFAKAEGKAFLTGDGSHKPLGIMDTASGVAKVKSGGASGITYAGLVNIQEEIYAAYRENAKWFTGRNGVAAFRKLVDDENRPLWNMDVRNGAPEQLLGRPIVLWEDMPDVGAGAFPIIYGDMRQAYTVVDAMGLRIAPDAYTAKPFVLMYTTRRVGGRVVLAEAIRILEIGT